MGGEAKRVKAEGACAIVLEVVSFAGGHEHHVSRLQRHAHGSTHEPAGAGEGLDYLQEIVAHRLHAEAARVMTFENEDACRRKLHHDGPKGARIEHATSVVISPE